MYHVAFSAHCAASHQRKGILFYFAFTISHAVHKRPTSVFVGKYTKDALFAILTTRFPKSFPESTDFCIFLKK
jgi:hypothetical protein